MRPAGHDVGLSLAVSRVRSRPRFDALEDPRTDLVRALLKCLIELRDQARHVLLRQAGIPRTAAVMVNAH